VVNRFTVLLLLLLVLCGGAVAALAQNTTGQQIARVRGGGFVAFKTTTEPAAAQEFSFSSAETESNVVHRVLIDKTGKFYFGYDLEIEPVLETRQFRVRVLPLSPEFDEQLKGRKDFKAKPLDPKSKLAGISESSRMEILNDGDGVALDILFNPETKVKIVDLISVSYDYLSLRETPVSNSPARDYTLNDVELKVSDYKLYLNGELVAGGKATGGYGGPVIWFYVPGRGRFILSIAPHDGYEFRKIGTVEHNKVSFTIGSDHYEWVSSRPIIGSGGNWNLWVLHDATYVSEFAPPEEPVHKPAVDVAVERHPESETNGSEKGEKPPKSATAFDVHLGMTPRREGVAAGSGPEPAQTPSTVPSPGKRMKLVFGVADRIENLLPRN
jgi:hypothetical protein